MGGKSTTTTQESRTTDPWAPAQPELKRILSGLGSIDPSLTGNENDAINHMVALARAGNPYAPAIDSYAATMLAGGGPDRTGLLTDAYNRYKTDLEGTAAGAYLDPNKNPFFANTTSAIQDAITNNVRAQFAGAGRDFSGAEQGTIAQNVTNALAPIYSNAYNTERSNQLNAQNALLNAAQGYTSELSGLDQTRLANMGAGVGAASSAINADLDPWNRLLTAETLRTSLPLSILQQLAGIATPIAGLGGQMQGTSNTTNQMSGAQQFATIAGGIGSLAKAFAPTPVKF